MTSIEWLMQEIKKHYPNDNIIDLLQEQAKELHKKEMETTWDEGKFEGRFNGEKRAEQYYQETFKK